MNTLLFIMFEAYIPVDLSWVWTVVCAHVWSVNISDLVLVLNSP